MFFLLLILLGSTVYLFTFFFPVCGNALTDQTGLITSPNYPNNYPHNRECVWTITANNGNQILLNITDFRLETHANCAFDFLEIRYLLLSYLAI